MANEPITAQLAPHTALLVSSGPGASSDGRPQVGHSRSTERGLHALTHLKSAASCGWRWCGRWAAQGWETRGPGWRILANHPGERWSTAPGQLMPPGMAHNERCWLSCRYLQLLLAGPGHQLGLAGHRAQLHGADTLGKLQGAQRLTAVLLGRGDLRVGSAAAHHPTVTHTPPSPLLNGVRELLLLTHRP